MRSCIFLFVILFFSAFSQQKKDIDLCQKRIVEEIHKFTPGFLSYQIGLTKYRLAFTGQILGISFSNNQKHVFESYLKKIKDDQDILKRHNKNYEKDLTHLLSLQPKYLDNNQMGLFIELISALMSDPKSSTFNKVKQSLGLSEKEMSEHWKSYGVSKIDAVTTNLVRELQLKDPHLDRQRLDFSKEYARDYLQRKKLKKKDMIFFAHLQNKIWKGKSSKDYGLSYRHFKNLDADNDKKISFSEYDQFFKETIENILLKSTECKEIDVAHSQCLKEIQRLPSLLNPKIMRLLEHPQKNYIYKKGALLSSDGKIALKKDFHKWKGVKAKCEMVFKDDLLPSIDLSSMPSTEEYYLIHSSQQIDKKEINRVFKGKQAAFRKKKNQEIADFFNERKLSYKHITNEMIDSNQKAKISTDYGKFPDSKNHISVMDNGVISISPGQKKNFVLISRYGNPPVFFSDCEKKTRSEKINPLSSAHAYQNSLQKAEEHLKEGNFSKANEEIEKAKEKLSEFNKNSNSKKAQDLLSKTPIKHPSEEGIVETQKTINDFNKKRIAMNPSKIRLNSIKSDPLFIGPRVRSDFKYDFELIDFNSTMIEQDSTKVNSLVLETNTIFSPKGLSISLKDLKAYEKKINNEKSNFLRIKKFYQTPLSGHLKCSSSSYGIVNKSSGKLIIYDQRSGSEKLRVKILTGKNKGDEILTWKNSKAYQTNESTTPAGSFTVKENRGKKKGFGDKYASYGNNLLPLIDDLGNDGIFALHQVPINTPHRVKMIKSNSKIRATNGCINILEEDFSKIEKELVGCKIHILPDAPHGKFIVKNGSLKFYYSQGNKTSGKYNITPSKIGKSPKPAKIYAYQKASAKITKKAQKTLSVEKSKLMNIYSLSNREYDELALLTMATLELECELGVDAKKYSIKNVLNFTGDEWLIRLAKGIKRRSISSAFEPLSRGCGQIKTVPKSIKKHYGWERTSYDTHKNTVMVLGYLAEAKGELNAIMRKWPDDCPLKNYSPKTDFIRFIYRGGTGKKKLKSCKIDLEKSPTLTAVVKTKSNFSLLTHLPGEVKLDNRGRGVDPRIALLDYKNREVLPPGYIRISKPPLVSGLDLANESYYDGFIDNKLCERVKVVLNKNGKYSREVIQKGYKVKGQCIFSWPQISNELDRDKRENIRKDKLVLTKIAQKKENSQEAKIYFSKNPTKKTFISNEKCFSRKRGNILQGVFRGNQCLLSARNIEKFHNERLLKTKLLLEGFKKKNFEYVTPRYGATGWDHRIGSKGEILPGKTIEIEKMRKRKKDKKLKYIVIHSTGEKHQSISALKSHQMFKRNFSDISYNFVIENDKTYEGRSLNFEAINHENPNDINSPMVQEAIHIGIMGASTNGKSLSKLIEDLQKTYQIPKKTIKMHSEIEKINCPHFNVLKNTQV